MSVSLAGWQWKPRRDSTVHLLGPVTIDGWRKLTLREQLGINPAFTVLRCRTPLAEYEIAVPPEWLSLILRAGLTQPPTNR